MINFYRSGAYHRQDRYRQRSPAAGKNGRMKTVLFILFLSIATLAVQGQEPIHTGSTYTLHTAVLKEQRTYRVALPKSYNDKKYAPASYPVIYVLDGESAFEYYAAAVNHLSKGVYASIPEMIVVGIDNTDRTRDLTPTRASRKSPHDSTRTLFTNSGGGNAFFKFLQTELIPLIDKNYRTSGYRIFSGHSFGGLTASHILLNHPAVFNAFIIHDPSYWWDDQLMLKQARALLPEINFNKTRVYLSQAKNEEGSALDAHFESIRSFRTICDSVNNPTLAFKYEHFEDEDHGTIPLPATHRGLKYIFEGYQINFKEISNDRMLLIDAYTAFSEKLNFRFIPSEEKLQFIIRYFSENKKIKEANTVRSQYSYFYPGISLQ